MNVRDDDLKESVHGHAATCSTCGREHWGVTTTGERRVSD